MESVSYLAMKDKEHYKDATEHFFNLVCFTSFTALLQKDDE